MLFSLLYMAVRAIFRLAPAGDNATARSRSSSFATK